MTREEREKAIDLLDNLVGMIEDNQDNDYDFALKKGIEALKQEDAIDKIRNEIKATYMTITYQENATWGLRKALQIIDKYKPKSEEYKNDEI